MAVEEMTSTKKTSMTADEWMACTRPEPMLRLMKGKATNRKLRLFAVACCRHIDHLIQDQRSRMAVDASEQFADGLISLEALRCAEAARTRRGSRRGSRNAGAIPGGVRSFHGVCLGWGQAAGGNAGGQSEREPFPVRSSA
jgi:hypothetical protein